MPDKFIREIEEILERAEDPGKDRRAPPRQRPPAPSGLSAALARLVRLLRLSPNKVVLGGVVLLFLAYLLNVLVPGLVPLYAWAGLVLLIIVYGIIFVRPGFEYERRSRGRLVDDGLPLSAWEKLKLWFKVRR